MRCTLVFLSDRCLPSPSVQLHQCVASQGRLCGSVVRMTCCTRSLVSESGAPLRAASQSPESLRDEPNPAFADMTRPRNLLQL